METVEEKPWRKTVNNNTKKKKNPLAWRSFCNWVDSSIVLRRDALRNSSIFRPWDALPGLALLTIFRNLKSKDRFGSIPLVCKEWNSIISTDPGCWSSMIPDSISPEDAFIKKPDYSIQVDPSSKLYDCEGQEVKRDPGVSYIRNLIKKSTTPGSSSSTITSLCLDRFHFSNTNETPQHNKILHLNAHETPHHNQILHLIAHSCPNLKHISFDGFYCASREAVLEVFHRCKKIELIDFSDSGYADSVQVIEVLGKCLPNLRGIRMAEWKKYSIHDAIAAHLPRIKLLAVDYRSSDDEDFRKLTSETECCLTELQYLSVGLWEIKEPIPVCTHIPEFHYEKLLGYTCVQPLRSVHQPKFRPRLISSTQVCVHCVCDKQDAEEEAKAQAILAEEEAKEAYSECSEEYFSFYYEDYSVMKQKKKYGYDVSISKEKKKRKKTRRNHSYLVLRTRMRKNKIMYNNSFNIDI